MNTEFDNERPIYIQLAEILRIKIITGELKQGQRIPSIRELALTMKVNPNTMLKALLELEKEQLIYTERTNGKYVTSNQDLISYVRSNIANEIVHNYLNKMQIIGLDYQEALKYLQNIGGKQNGITRM